MTICLLVNYFYLIFYFKIIQSNVLCIDEWIWDLENNLFYYLETYFISKVENAADVKGTSQSLRINLQGNSG